MNSKDPISILARVTPFEDDGFVGVLGRPPKLIKGVFKFRIIDIRSRGT